MAPRSSSVLASTAVLACSGIALLHSAFVSPGGARPAVAHAPPTAPAATQATPAAPGVSARRIAAGAAMGLAGAAAVAAGAARRPRVAARVASGQPSLIQVLEQKRLLSLVERLGLLSTAERAGVRINDVERSGLLTLLERRGLLSGAESVLCNPSTPTFLLLAAAVAAGGVYLDLAASETPDFLQWVLAGALGLPALVLAGAGLVILTVFGGARQTRRLDLTEKVDTFTTSGATGTFSRETVSRPVTLLNVVEEKGLLSFAEENGLLSLAASFVDKPLTLTEDARVLSQLESAGLLSAVESGASDAYGAAGAGLAGLAAITAAIACAVAVPDYGALLALALGLPGAGLLGVGLGLSVLQAPRRGR